LWRKPTVVVALSRRHYFLTSKTALIADMRKMILMVFSWYEVCHIS
jgi:hypothetical protein